MIGLLNGVKSGKAAGKKWSIVQKGVEEINKKGEETQANLRGPAQS